MSSGLSVDGITSGSRVQEVAMRRADDMFNKLDSLGSLAKTSEPSFADRFVDSLNSVAEAQNTSKTMTQNYELGKENDLAKVMVAQQVSSLTHTVAGFREQLNVSRVCCMCRDTGQRGNQVSARDHAGPHRGTCSAAPNC